LISYLNPGRAELLLSLVMGASLAMTLVTDKGFGVLLGLLLVASFFALRPRELAALRRRDGWFLVLFNAYPAMMALSLLVQGGGDIALLDNASRFLAVSVVYLTLRAKAFNLGVVVLGAVAGCCLAGAASLLGQAQGLLMQEPGALVRYGGTANPAVFAQLLFFLLLVAVTPIELPRLSGLRGRILLVAAVLLTATGVVMSQTRAVLLALAVFSVYLLFFDARLRSTSMTKSAVMLGIAASLLYLFNSAHLDHLSGTASELGRAFGHFDQQTSLGQRLSQWVLCLQLIAERPAFGYGVGQFSQALAGLPDATALTERVRSYGHAHSDYLQIAVELGLVGLVVFLTAMAALVLAVFREGFPAAARHLLVGTVSGWSFFALTQTQFAHQKTTMMFAFLLALGFSFGMNEKYGPLRKSRAAL